jgi:predicted nuclease of predicted toxin-antitoxin system
VKVKLDENVHTDVAPALRALGHDVLTVHDQSLAGHPDADIANAVQQEQRILVTFDLDFADIRRYPPSWFAGIVVLRLTAPTLSNQVNALTRFFAEFSDISGHLWIVEHTRARDWTS